MEPDPGAIPSNGLDTYGRPRGFWLTSPPAMPHSAPIRPSIALAAFAERFVDGRRIVVFGNALSPLWEQLIERGARLVHVCDADTARVSEAAARNTSQNVSFAPLGGSGLAVRDGAFDVGFIENLATFADPASALHKLRRALSARGVALVAAPNPDVEDALIASGSDSRTLDYYSIYDLVHREFSVVRMAGQMPFVGYSVAELAPAEEPTPCIDAGFVPGGTEEPEWFVAIASQIEVEFESFLVVQLPHNQLTKNGTERQLREQLRSARSAERSAVERLSRLEAEQRRLSEVAQRHQKDVDLARQIRLLQEELERKESWILQLEARAATADARADEADQELEELRTRIGQSGDDSTKPLVSAEDWRKLVEHLETEKCDLVGKLTQTESRASEAEQRLVAEKAVAQTHVDQLEQQQRELVRELEVQKTAGQAQFALAETQRKELEQLLTQAQARITELSNELGQDDPLQVSELSHLEIQLKERGERIRQLELDLKRTEDFGAKLVRELTRAQRKLESEGMQRDVTAAIPAVARESDLDQGPPTQAVSTIATESWTSGPKVATPASTHLSAAQSSAWTDSHATPRADSERGNAPPGDGSAPMEEMAALRSKLDSLASLAARQQADLMAYDWRLQQVLLDNVELRQQADQCDDLTRQLERARQNLQENEVLFVQLGARNST